MDEQSFISLAQELRRVAVDAALTLLDDDGEAEDVAQETMLRMWKKIDSLDDDKSRVKALATVTASNLARNRLRQKRRWPVLRLLSQHDIETGDTPLHRIEVSDADKAFDQALQRLPIVWQRILRMRNIENMRFVDIAGVLGTSESSVRGLLSKARKRMVELINQQIR